MDGWMDVCGSWASAVRFWGHNDFGEGSIRIRELTNSLLPLLRCKGNAVHTNKSAMLTEATARVPNHGFRR